MVLGLSLPTSAAGKKNVVILSSLDSSRPAQDLVIAPILGVFATSAEPIEIFSEAIDAGRFPGPASEARLTTFFRDKYSTVPVDLVIAVGPEALAFLVRHGEPSFSDAPWVFTGIRESTLARDTLPPNATGVLSRFDLIETLELALALQPKAARVVVITGAAALDTAWLQLARERLRPYEERLEVTYFAGLPLAQLTDDVSQLPKDSIVLFLSIITDADGQDFRVPQHAAALFAASSAPVYGVYETLLGLGIVGGNMERFSAIGDQTGRLALRILQGASPAELPPRFSDPAVSVVDWRQLERWGLDEARLPPGTIVERRELSVWDQYRSQIVTVTFVVLLQAAAIVALLLFHVRKRRAERALQESEERYRDVVEAQTDLICRYLPDSTLTFVNDAYCRYFGRSREDLVGKRFLDLIPAEERAGYLSHLDSLAVRPRTEGFEHRALRADGSVGWLQWIYHAIVGANGRIEIQGVGRDVTQLKLAENEAVQRREQVVHLTRVAILGELSGALAHELSQPLTAILMNVQSAQRLLEDGNVDVAELGSILVDVANDDRRAAEVIVRLRALLKKGHMQLESLDASSLVEEVLTLARGQLVEHRVRVVKNLAGALPARGDRVHLQQVLLNLLVNACDAVSANNERDRLLTIETASAEDGYLRVSIADNGIGLPPEGAERIFEPFFTTKRQGLGLGLSICRSIAAAHGGQLVATNNGDRGAMFTLLLPSERAAA